MVEAVEELPKRNYLLVSICTGSNDYLPYLKLLREIKPIPIIIVPPNFDSADKLQAIELGVDIYLEMPQTMEECVATAWALVRRYTELNYKGKSI